MVQATDNIEGMEENLPKAIKLLTEMSYNADAVSGLVEGMLERVRSGELSTEFGLSFLEVKYHSLIDYLINLMHVVLRKCKGESTRIEQDPSIDRLIELRSILEKIRPIDHKLRYQIDKLVKTATTRIENDSSSFKARPDMLVSQLIEAGSENEEEGEDEQIEKYQKESSSTGLYRPPKLTAVPYDGDGAEEKRSKQFERARKRALNSSLIQEMKVDLLDTPVEVNDGSRADQAYSRAQKERERFEENNFVRLPVTKAEKHKQKRLTTLGTLGDEITSFRDISALTGGYKQKKREPSERLAKRKVGLDVEKRKGFVDFLQR